MKWVCFPKFYSPLANWPWLRISPQSSLCVIYSLILTAWQWLMSFTCILVQIEPNKSPLRKRLLALFLWEIGHLSSPSRSCLGRLILICGGWGSPAGRAPPPIGIIRFVLLNSQLKWWVFQCTHNNHNIVGRAMSKHQVCEWKLWVVSQSISLSLSIKWDS